VQPGDLLIEQLQLRWVELLADLEKHVDVLLLQIAAGPGDAVDCGKDPGFVLEIAGGMEARRVCSRRRLE